jgi:hypothetical protein
MGRSSVIPLVLALATVGPARGDAELVLEDGQRIAGREVERKGDLYLVELETGNVMPVPVALVTEVRLTGEDVPEPTAFRVAQGETIVGHPAGPRLPKPHEQLAVFGEPSRFVRAPIDPTWYPESAYDTDPALNNFNPARWYVPPIDPIWRPRSGLRGDVTNFNPARWYHSPIDPTWWPTDGFRRPQR